MNFLMTCFCSIGEHGKWFLLIEYLCTITFDPKEKLHFLDTYLFQAAILFSRLKRNDHLSQGDHHRPHDVNYLLSSGIAGARVLSFCDS